MPHTKRVFDAMEQDIHSSLGERLGLSSLLYVGWRHDCKPWWHDTYGKLLGGRIGVLEIFPKNLADLELEVWSGRYEARPILGDVRDIGRYVGKGEYDVIFWDHGPEHVTREDLALATPLLRDWAKKALVYCCPWGEWVQGAEDGNEHEIHRNYVTDDELRKLGMTVHTFGSPGQAGEGELLAYCLK